MQFSLVVSLVLVLAIAHGSECASLSKRDVQAEVDRITVLLKDMKDSIATATQDMVDTVTKLQVANTAQTKIQPLVSKVQEEASRLQGQVQPLISKLEDQVRPLKDNIQAQVQPLFSKLEDQVKPLADNLNAQVKPLADMVEQFLQKVLDHTKALMPPPTPPKQ